MSNSESGQPKTTRRSLLKWTAALAGAAVVGAVAGFGADILQRPNTVTTQTVTTTTTTTPPPPATISYKPPLSPVVQARATAIIQDRVNMHSGETTAYSGFMGGSVNMGVCTGLYKLHLKGGLITAVEPDDTWNAGVAREDAGLSTAQLSKSHLQARIKANGYTWFLYHKQPDRILYPMKRTNARGDPNGQFVRITWTEAMDSLASMVTNVKSKYGPYSSNGGPLSAYTGIGVGTWGDVSWGSEDIASEWILGAPQATIVPKFPRPKSGLVTGGLLLDIFNSKSIILWGRDPTVAGDTGPRQNGADQYLYRLAREKGIPIICVDVRYGMQAEVIADQFIPIRPGTDLAALIAMCNVLIKENLYNKDYVNKFVDSTGFAKWKDYVLGVTDGVDKTPVWAEPITGVPADTIAGLARFLAANVPCHFIPGAAPGRKYQGDRYMRAAFILNAMVGNFGIPGGAPAYCEYNHWNPGSPSPDYGRASGTYSAPALMKSYTWADAVILKAQLDKGTITQAKYDATVGKDPADPTPNIKMMFKAMSNGFNQGVNLNKQLQAIKLMDYFVVGAYHWNPTAKAADLVLPIAEMFEDYYGFAAFANGMVWCRKLVQPPGEAKPMEWIYTQLAKRLSFADKYMPAYTSDDQWDAMVEAAMQKGYETWAKSASVTALGITIPSWTDFKANPVIRCDTPAVTYPLKAQISDGVPFGTNSGKIEFWNSYVAGIDMSKTAAGGPWPALPVYEAQPQGFYDPLVNTYPLEHLDSHNRYRAHSSQDSDAMLNELWRHSVWISPSDAKARGIVDNDMVRVFNDAGQMLLPAYVTSRIVPGTLYVWDGGWAQFNAAGIDKAGCPNTVCAGGWNAHAQDPHNDLVEVQKF